MIKIKDKSIGRVNELHGVNCAPYLINDGKEQSLTKKIFEFAGIPRSRLHDVCGSYGGTYFLDIPNIFRNFDADEKASKNYDFHYSDEYITSIIQTGAQIVFRLGVTIEWGTKKYTIAPPSDFKKWARVCEHIVRHYNEGWANGFFYNIEYWEIWNEPENPPMWSGTKEQFFELYKTASIHLKSKFPGLKIGGYGSCGFYSIFRENMSDFFRSFVPYFEDFLCFVKSNDCPLDFYSWHIYTSKIHEVSESAKFVRRTLDKNGFKETESHLNEWNYGEEGGGFNQMETMTGASFCAAVLIAMQSGGIDKAQYYCLSAETRYNGFINLRTFEFTPVAHVFAAFNLLYRADAVLDIESCAGMPYFLAAQKGNERYALISNYGKKETSFSLIIENAADDMYVHLYELKDRTGFCPIAVMPAGKDKSVALKCEENGVYLIIINNNSNEYGLIAAAN